MGFFCPFSMAGNLMRCNAHCILRLDDGDCMIRVKFALEIESLRKSSAHTPLAPSPDSAPQGCAHADP